MAGSSPNEVKSPNSPRSPEEDLEQDTEAAAYQAENTIEAGDEFDDGYESDSASGASTSITSSVRDFSFENGRRYHKFREGQYQFPVCPPKALPQVSESSRNSLLGYKSSQIFLKFIKR
jgi:hypothetical protein